MILAASVRVVTGAVLASDGSLAIVTRNRRIVVRPETDGSTSVVKVAKANFPMGTRIEIGFGAALPDDADPFVWVRAAQAIATAGETYQGRSSPFWYDDPQFHELLLAYGTQPVRSLIAQLDGCTGGKAGEIVSDARLDRLRCQDIDRKQATKLLAMARAHARPVSPDRLGHVGRDAFPHHYYAREHGTASFGASKLQAEVPFVVEAWATKLPGYDKANDDVDIAFLVNRTPIVAEISAWRGADSDLNIQGGGLDHDCSDAPKKGAYRVRVNITTPYCPITSDGKEPDLGPFADAVLMATEIAMRKAQRAAPKDRKVSQKDVVLDHLANAIAAASGDDAYRFNERQIFYQLRPIVLQETGQELQIGNFKRVITDYENENGEIPGMYREPRGSISHPHSDDDFPLGTLTVEDYQRPVWTFNKMLFIEKEGFKEALKSDGWPERYDCALMSSKGFTTRAARDLVDKLAEHDEPVTVFCVHDADAFGTMIHQTFQEATKARGARKVRIVNLGLEPWEAVAAGLEVETVEQGNQRKAVADYVRAHANGAYWEDWLQTHRVELNAMTTPEFIAWLDRKMAKHGDGKLVPPDDVIAEELETRLADKVRKRVIDRILREANAEDQIAEALAAIERPSAEELEAGIRQLFDRTPASPWRDHIEAITDALSYSNDRSRRRRISATGKR
jgi:hypothetical protein